MREAFPILGMRVDEQEIESIKEQVWNENDQCFQCLFDFVNQQLSREHALLSILF